MRAEILRLTQERDECKEVFENALSHVDNVFQLCQEVPNPILPEYSRPGENKFAAVERLARDYMECRKLLRFALEHAHRNAGNADNPFTYLWQMQWDEFEEAAKKAAGGE